MSATIYFHADCLDGFGAAWAAWRRFGDAARYRPLHHGDDWREEDVADQDVYILDFAFPPTSLEAIARQARSTTQLDHHATARSPWVEHLQNLGDDGEIHVNEALGLRVVFNLDQSGATLAWRHFHPDQPIPLLLRHVEDIDLWRFALPDTRPFCRALHLEPFAFEHWNQLADHLHTPASPAYPGFLQRGQAIEDFLQAEIKRLALSPNVIPAQLRGNPIDPLQALRHGQSTICDGETHWLRVDALAINANALFASELGHQLALRAGGIALIWHLAPQGIVRASLRSLPGIDAGLIASHYGGGGHPGAAGFRMPVENFLKEVLLAS